MAALVRPLLQVGSGKTTVPVCICLNISLTPGGVARCVSREVYLYSDIVAVSVRAVCILIRSSTRNFEKAIPGIWSIPYISKFRAQASDDDVGVSNQD